MAAAVAAAAVDETVVGELATAEEEVEAAAEAEVLATCTRPAPAGLAGEALEAAEAVTGAVEEAAAG